MKSPITVLCVDDSASVAAALAMLVDDERDMKSVGTIQRAAEILPAIRDRRPAIAVIDLSLDGDCPLPAIRAAAQECPGTRAIVFSGYDDPETIDKAIEAGAQGFVSKSAGLEGVIAAIREVAEGRSVVRAR